MASHHLISPLVVIFMFGFIGLSNSSDVNPNEQQIRNNMFLVSMTDSCVKRGSEWKNELSDPDAQTLVRVVNPKDITIGVVDKIQLGSEIEARIQVTDTSGAIIPADYHPMLHLEPESSSDVITITSGNRAAGTKESVFNIRGDKLGTTSLTFKAWVISVNGKKRITTSPDVNIEVITPVKIETVIPKLIVGANYQIRVSGGPSDPGSATLEYSVSDPSLAHVTSNGIVEARRIGVTRVLAKLTKGQVVYSTDSIPLIIVPLQGVKIVSPSHELFSGSSLNLMLNGLGPNDELLSPLSFGSVVPNLKITWSVSDPQIMELKCVYYPLGLCGSDRNEFSTRGTGVEEGTVTISVSVEVTQESKSSHQYQLENNRKMIDYIQVKVVSGSGLKNKITPNDPRLMILMSPGSELRLESTKDGIYNISYELKGDTSVEFNEIILDESEPQHPVLKSLSNVPSEATLEMKDPSGIVKYPVYVQPVSHFMMVIDMRQTNVRPVMKSGIHHVPLGSSIKLRVNFYNRFGQEFDAVSPFKTNLTVNRFDLIQYSWHQTKDGHQVLSVTGVREGTTLIHIWTDPESNHEVQMNDYIYVRVGKAY